MAEAKAIRGMVLNTRGQPITDVKVNLTDVNGAVLLTAIAHPSYTFMVMDGFRGTVSVPDQVVGQVHIVAKDNMKNYAVVATPEGGYTYYIVVASQTFDPMDTNLSGDVSFEELKTVVVQLQLDVAQLKKMMPK